MYKIAKKAGKKLLQFKRIVHIIKEKLQKQSTNLIIRFGFYASESQDKNKPKDFFLYKNQTQLQIMCFEK